MLSKKSQDFFLFILPIILLIMAMARLPYEYYIFLRFYICTAAALIAKRIYHSNESAGLLMIAIAILYNPFIPMHFKKDAWTISNLITVAIFIGVKSK